MFKINVGKNLREYRMKKGLTQENVAELLEMSVGNYANIERGKTHVKVDRLEDIAEKLDTDIFELLALGQKNVIYIQGSENNNDESNRNNQSAYIINNSLPNDYQSLLIKSERLEVESKFYKEKIDLLEEKIAYLEEKINLLKNK